MFLKQSTATTIKLGPFKDSTHGITDEVSLSLVQADIQISKNGAAYAQTSDSSPTTTHDVEGWYPIPLTTTDTNTVGRIKVMVNATGALSVWSQEYLVLPANIYDSFVGGTDTLQADMVQIDGAATNGNNATLNLAQLNITNSGGTAVVMNSTGGSGHGLSISGNGSAHGINTVGGATGNGLKVLGGATSGAGMQVEAQGGNSNALTTIGDGSGHGASFNAGATGNGLKMVGTAGYAFYAVNSSGDAGRFESLGGNGDGLQCLGDGLGSGLECNGGSDAHGIEVTGGSTAGDGINITVTSGSEINYGGTELMAAINAEADTALTDYTGPIPANVTQIDGAATSGNNATLNLAQLNITNSGGTAAILSSTGGGGHGLSISGDGGGAGIISSAGATGIGLDVNGGGTSGIGLAVNSTSGNAVQVVAGGGNGHGFSVAADGTGSGIKSTAGATGTGMELIGGATSGTALTVTTTSGDAAQFTAGGGGGDGIHLTADGSGNGLYSVGGDTGNGMFAYGGSTSGSGFRIESQAGNSNGFTAIGIGNGHGMSATAGATGNGFQLNGGATSGNALDLTVTSGNEIDYGGNAGVDIGSIGTSTTAATKMKQAFDAMQVGTVSNAVSAPTDTIILFSDLTEATSDHFKYTHAKGITGALAGQIRPVDTYALDTGEGKITLAIAFTEAPANGDLVMLF